MYSYIDLIIPKIYFRIVYVFSSAQDRQLFRSLCNSVAIIIRHKPREDDDDDDDDDDDVLSRVTRV